jgi:selenocysteine lyase/cysteine desulfurase
MRELFPVLSECVYLNTAYTGPLSLPLLEHQKEADEHYFKLGDQFKKTIEKSNFKNAKQQLADFVGATEENTLITSNFSFAFQSFLFHLTKESHFLLLEEEYPSLTDIVTDHGFNSTKIPVTEKIEEQVWEALCQNTYQVFALSAVQYTTGLMFDFEWLKKIKQAFPEVIILVDGTQFIGAENFNFSSSPVDALFGSTYKWIMAGYGTGYAIFKDDLLDRLDLSHQRIDDIYGRGQVAIKAVGGLCTALKLIKDKDFSFQLSKKHQLNRFLKAELTKRNLLEDWVLKRKNHASIYSLKISEYVYKGLLEQNIRCVWRGKGVRISVHFYNNVEDIKQFLLTLDLLLESELCVN